MTLEVRRQTACTEELLEAFARLLPQLSPRLGALAPEAAERIVASPATALFAARSEEGIVGLLTLAWYDAPSGRKAWIEDVVVDRSARGCGAGHRLVAEALRHAARIGAGRVELTSAPHREAARALYRKMGFKEAETTLFVLETDKK
ncbi:MAG: GNAT family N-acetyltransferase [Alistipes sp.]|nr:GNAT family N-acetyltransferase [Alistipes sp.]